MISFFYKWRVLLLKIANVANNTVDLVVVTISSLNMDYLTDKVTITRMAPDVNLGMS
jgi:hypothetical protein